MKFAFPLPSSLIVVQDASKLDDPIREALRSIEKLQFRLEKTDTGITRVATKPLQRKKQKVNSKNNRNEIYLFLQG